MIKIQYRYRYTLGPQTRLSDIIDLCQTKTKAETILFVREKRANAKITRFTHNFDNDLDFIDTNFDQMKNNAIVTEELLSKFRNYTIQKVKEKSQVTPSTISITKIISIIITSLLALTFWFDNNTLTKNQANFDVIKMIEYGNKSLARYYPSLANNNGSVIVEFAKKNTDLINAFDCVAPVSLRRQDLLIKEALGLREYTPFARLGINLAQFKKALITRVGLFELIQKWQRKSKGNGNAVQERIEGVKSQLKDEKSIEIDSYNKLIKLPNDSILKNYFFQTIIHQRKTVATVQNTLLNIKAEEASMTYLHSLSDLAFSITHSVETSLQKVYNDNRDKVAEAISDYKNDALAITRSVESSLYKVYDDNRDRILNSLSEYKKEAIESLSTLSLAILDAFVPKDFEEYVESSSNENDVEANYSIQTEKEFAEHNLRRTQTALNQLITETNTIEKVIAQITAKAVLSSSSILDQEDANKINELLNRRIERSKSRASEAPTKTSSSSSSSTLNSVTTSTLQKSAESSLSSFVNQENADKINELLNRRIERSKSRTFESKTPTPTLFSVPSPSVEPLLDDSITQRILALRKRKTDRESAREASKRLKIT